jgi:competence protein ComFC
MADLHKVIADFQYKAYQTVWSSLDWIYPPTCAGCGKNGYRWCPECQSLVEVVGSTVCQVCGDRVNSGNLCCDCQKNRPIYGAMRSFGLFNGPLREALHHLKYRRDICLGEILSRSLIDYFADLGWKVDLIIPVPLSGPRLRQRGYNQAALLARPIALKYGIKYSTKALLRVKDTKSQVSLTIDQRRQNVADAFLANPKVARGSSVLLVDDVTTTGATIEAGAKALFNSGADQVYALTLARA